MSQYIYRKSSLIFLAKLADLILRIFYFKRKSNFTEPIQKILAVNFGHLGDILLMTPFLDILRENFPASRIDILVDSENRLVLKNNRAIDNVLVYSAFHCQGEEKKRFYLNRLWRLFKNLRKEKYDLFFDLKGDPLVILLGFLSGAGRRIGYGTGGLGRLLTDEVKINQNQHQIFINLDLLKPLNISFKKEKARPSIVIPPKFFTRAENFLEQKNIAPRDFLIVIHPGSGYQSKIWPTKYWAELIDKLILKPRIKIIIIGRAGELPLIKNIIKRVKDTKNLFTAMDLDLPFLAAIISQAKLFIGSDSCPAHIAATVDTPVISIFSAANNPVRWQPYISTLTLFYKNVPCANCEKKFCGDKICLKNIKPAEVFNAILYEK